MAEHEELLYLARSWIEDTSVQLVGVLVEPDRLTDDQVQRSVEKHFPGGWEAFAALDGQYDGVEIPETPDDDNDGEPDPNDPDAVTNWTVSYACRNANGVAWIGEVAVYADECSVEECATDEIKRSDGPPITDIILVDFFRHQRKAAT